jgi:hypothetical protein
LQQHFLREEKPTSDHFLQSEVVIMRYHSVELNHEHMPLHRKVLPKLNQSISLLDRLEILNLELITPEPGNGILLLILENKSSPKQNIFFMIGRRSHDFFVKKYLQSTMINIFTKCNKQLKNFHTKSLERVFRDLLPQILFGKST